MMTNQTMVLGWDVISVFIICSDKSTIFAISNDVRIKYHNKHFNDDGTQTNDVGRDASGRDCWSATYTERGFFLFLPFHNRPNCL